MADPPANIDQYYARTCARAGTVALILSAVAILIFVRSFSWDRYAAVIELAFAQQQLVLALDDMIADNCWPDSIEDRSTAPVVRAYLSFCVNNRFDRELEWEERQAVRNGQPLPAPSEETIEELREKLRIAVEKKAPTEGDSRRPMPPIFTLTATNTGGEPVLTAIESLRDEQRLSLARRYRNWLGFEIYRWEMRRYRLSSEARNRLSAEYPISLNIPIDLLLSSEELRELGNSFPISLEDIEKDSAIHYIGLPNIPFATNLRQAAYLLCVVLLVLSVYFWLNLRLAKKRPNFPVEGTAFHTFLSTRLGASILYGLILTPGIASLLLVYNPLDHNWYGFAIAALTLTIVCLAVRQLHEQTT